MKEILLSKENIINYSLNSSKINKDKLEYNKLEDVTKKRRHQYVNNEKF